MKKQSFWKQVETFLTGKGFYMAMVLCLAAIGVSGWYVWQSFQQSQRPGMTQVSGGAEVTVTPETEMSLEEGKENDDMEELAEEAEETASTEEAVEESEKVNTVVEETITDEETPMSAENVMDEVPVEETVCWTMPVEGEVVTAFSAEELVYNEVMEDWRTHEGVDIACGIGDEVHAACGGTVQSVEQDHLLGWTVTVDCGDGVTACYGNLAEDCPVVAGAEVDPGDVIGAVGDTAAGEACGVAWLHFAVAKDGVNVDPMEFVKR